MKDMKELLHSAHLTKTQKIIAEYVLDNAWKPVLRDINGDRIKTCRVMNLPLIRFSRTIGFDGFMDFQKALRKDYQDKVLQHFQQYYGPIPAYRKAGQIRHLF